MHLYNFISLFSSFFNYTGKVELTCGQKTSWTYIITLLETEQQRILEIKSP